MNTLKILIEVPPLKQHEFEHAVTQMIAVPPHPDHMQCSISKNVGKPNTFIYMEEWDCNEEMYEHFHHEDFRSLLGAMKALGTIKDAKILSSETIKPFTLDI